MSAPSRGTSLGAGVSAGIASLLIAAYANAALPVRPTTLTWDNNRLHGVLPLRDAIDDKAIQEKLKAGLSVTLVVRGYVDPIGGGNPVALMAHTCHIAFHLWDEIYQVTVDGVKKPPAVNMKGVYRLCTDVDLVIVDRALLKGASTGYELDVKVEVNPVSAEMLKQIQSWVTRPTGTSGAIGPGDALFAGFVGLFMTKVPTADKVIDFQTGPLPP